MTAAKAPAVFLDTSIQIARLVHGPTTKKKIKERLGKHERTVTGLVARQEFKRRLLKEAEYLLRLLHRYGSFDEVQQHLIRLPSTYKKNERKKNISLQMLNQVHETNDAERTDRLRLYLRSLLVQGLKRFDQSVDSVLKESGCHCANVKVIEKQELRKYELGPIRCSQQTKGSCGVIDFLVSRRPKCEKLLSHLRLLPPDRKTREISQTERFLDMILKQSDHAVAEDPCLTVGDLMIALESVDQRHFFTLNSAESQHLCRALDQTLIVQPVNPLEPEIVCNKEDENWPQFGKKFPTDSGDQ